MCQVSCPVSCKNCRVTLCAKLPLRLWFNGLIQNMDINIAQPHNKSKTLTITKIGWINKLKSEKCKCIVFPPTGYFSDIFGFRDQFSNGCKWSQILFLKGEKIYFSCPDSRGDQINWKKWSRCPSFCVAHFHPVGVFHLNLGFGTNFQTQTQGLKTLF